jgi:hypothetical protein
MCHVKYFINHREPDAILMAEQLREAHIDFSSMPTSGPLTLWVDGSVSYGPTAVKLAVKRLLETERVEQPV